MSAFIVISVKDSLNWIVDGIKKCRPHNPNVITYLSTGKINKEDSGKYFYEYSVFSKHSGDGNADKTLVKSIESDIPRNLFSNQIAQFLHVCENEGEQVNIFLIDNPITDSDFEQSSWLVDEIREVYESHKITNFQLVRVLFSYEIDRPTDINRQVSQMILKKLVGNKHDDSKDFLPRILYIDNQNRSGAAMCLNKEGHDIMIPRMLCDLMMLLSNNNDSYNVTSAIGSQTNMFSVGYSECMYYHDDVFRYYDLAGRRDLTQYLLMTKNNDESLDFERHPIGLEDRMMRLGPKYKEVSFKSDINSYVFSIDKTIDDIIVSFKDDIINIRKEALDVAIEKDAEETKKRQILNLKESGLLPNDISDENLDSNYIQIAEEKGIDLSEFVTNDATEKAKRDYPIYIDRHQIYEESLVEDEEGEDFEGSSIDVNIKAYNNLIHFIQTGTFKRYLRKQCNDGGTQFTTVPNSDFGKTGKKVCFFKRLFCKKNEVDKKASTQTTQFQPQINKRDWHSQSNKIASIHDMYEERDKYYLLEEKVLLMQKELNCMNDDLRLFKLTNHCSSVDNLIDLDKLREHHESEKNNRIAIIVNKWDSRNEDNKSYNAFFDDLKEQTKWDVFGYYYIDWAEPFDFIKSIDLSEVCETIKKRSQPYVNTYTLAPIAENQTSYYFYTDNQKWYESINHKTVIIRDNNQISCTLSNHICSKICMFQFLPMTTELIRGLVDCFDSERNKTILENE